MTVDEFSEQFRTLYLPLGMYALRILGDVKTSEDCVQDSFADIWLKIKNGEDIRDFKGYIYRAVHNKALNMLKHKDFEYTDGLAAYCEEPLADDMDVLEREIELSRRDAAVWQAISSLSPRCREVFLLAKRDGLGYRQISEHLGISVKTVENQMSKALKSLRSIQNPVCPSESIREEISISIAIFLLSAGQCLT